MKIISYNIACVPNIFDYFSKRLINITKILKFLNADIIALQEVFTSYARNHCIDKLKNQYNIILSPIHNIFLNGGLLIATKYNIKMYDYYIYKNNYGEDSLANKGILYCQVINKKKIYHIFNTHLNNNKPLFSLSNKKSYNIHKKQIIEFLYYVKYIKNKFDSIPTTTIDVKKNTTYLLIGDFNLNKTFFLYKQFINTLKLYFNVYINDNEIITDNINNIQIDYIIQCYYYDSLTSTKSTTKSTSKSITKSNISDKLSSYKIYTSDHNLILNTL